MNQKKHPVLTTCPVCKHELNVVKLHCEHCDTEVTGTFTLSKFNYLETEKLYFIEIFIKNRGNIKAIEKELNISYPTVKKMLDEVIVGLGYSADYDEEEDIKEKENKKDLKNQIKQTILEQIEKGQMTVNEALEALKKNK
ncbi:MAG: DUF2089 domain-containing protein [Acholeplasmataceae bacterium]|jgi:hypothetical protein|nr:DUF2089 domain-containing protein [Acholeplasmataceae bacterium]